MTPTTKNSKRRGSAAVLVAVGAAIAGAAVILALVFWPEPAAETFTYVVPQGTQSRIDAGEEISLFPRDLEVRLGDRLVIENEDEATHQVGPYVIGAGQRIEQHFGVSGTIEGFCTLHPSGQVAIVVR